MADTDLFGIVFLLLAVAGAAYLVWARVLRPGAEKSAARPAARTEHGRASDTMPPVLRPEAELTPKMLAKREALRRSSRPPPDTKTSDVAPPTPAPPKREPPNTEPAKGRAEAPKSEPHETPARTNAPGPELASTNAKPSSETNTPAGAASAPPPSKKTGDAVDDMPQIDTEEDEDLEPTKVGPLAKQGSIQPIVEQIVFDEGADQPPEESSSPPRLVVHAFSQTDTGRRRKQNEDSLLVLERGSLFVVADGMGGHRGGQHASKLAVKTIGDAFESKTFDGDAHKDVPPEASELARAMQMANTAIFQEAKKRPELTGMGTTLCAARFTQDKQRLYLGHVGDSRCYRLRDGVMKQMTNDHTMADYGVAGPEGAHLSRAIGVWPTVPIDMIMAAPKLGDIYLLCSDGLTKMVPDTTIATQLLHEEDPRAAVERLVFFANAAGGKDNITIILLRVVEPD